MTWYRGTQSLTDAGDPAAALATCAYNLQPGGTVTDIDLAEVFSHGGSIKSAWYGDTLPERDFPMFVDQYRLGRLDLDSFVSERITMDDVQSAFEKMKQGRVLRSVVEVGE